MNRKERKRSQRDPQQAQQLMRQAALPHVAQFKVEYAAFTTAYGRPPSLAEFSRAAAKIMGLTPGTTAHYASSIKDVLGPFTDARFQNKLKTRSTGERKPRDTKRDSVLDTVTLDDLLISDRTSDEFSVGKLSGAQLNARLDRYFADVEPKYRVASHLATKFISANIRTKGEKTCSELSAYTGISFEAGQEIVRTTGMRVAAERTEQTQRNMLERFTYTAPFYAAAERLVRARQLSPNDIAAITGAPITELVQRTGVPANNILPLAVEEGQAITAAHLAYFAYRRTNGATPEESAGEMGFSRKATNWFRENGAKEQERLCLKLEALAGQPLSVPYATNHPPLQPAILAPARKKPVHRYG